MSDICTTQTKQLNKVLNGKYRYSVPAYQRRYDWKYNDEVEELYGDLLGNYQEEYGREYLLGPIVIVDEKKEDLKIVDGQQRLVTLSLWFCALLDYLKNHQKDFEQGGDTKAYCKLVEKIQKTIFKDDGTSLIKLNHDGDNNIFDSICRGNKDKLSIKNKVVASYNELHRSIKTHYDKMESDQGYSKTFDEIDKLFDNIMDNTTFVYVTINDEQYAHQVFQSLNSKGQELKQADLIKSAFMRFKDSEDQIKSKWNEMARYEGISKNFDDFLYYSMLSRWHEHEIRKNGMYTAVKNYDRKKIQEYLGECCSDVDIYRVLDDPNLAESDNFDFNDDLIHIFHGFDQIRAKYFKRIIIAAYRRWGKHKETKDLLDCLLKFFFMYRTICKKDIDRIKAIARDATYGITGGKDIAQKNLAEILKGILYDEKGKEHITKKEFEKEFESNISELSSGAIKYVLYSIERKAQYDKGQIIKEKYQLEHIFPKTPKKGAWPNEKSMIDHRERLGNITLLSPPWNKALKNRSFEDKRNSGDKCYKKSGIILNGHLQKCEKWDVKEITKREKDLCEQMTEICNLDKYLKMTKK